MLRHLFSRLHRRMNGNDMEETSDHYLDLVQETLERCGIAWDSLIVEIQSVGLAVDQKTVYAAMVYLDRWERTSALRLLMGLPLIEARVREAARNSWLASHSHFTGLWVHASARLQFPDELRHLIQEITHAQSKESNSFEYSKSNKPSTKYAYTEANSFEQSTLLDPCEDVHGPHSRTKSSSRVEMNLFDTIFQILPLRKNFKPNDGILNPYRKDDANSIYKLLFCDDPRMFEIKEGLPPTEWQRAMYLEPNTRVLEFFALDAREDARVRFHIFRVLRTLDVHVPYKMLMGVVIERQVKGGLDTLAIYADGHIQRIAPNGTTFMTDEPDGLASIVTEVCNEAQALAYLVLPDDATRWTPLTLGRMRISVLTSQGIYTIEGSECDMQTNTWTSKLVRTSNHLASGLDCYCT